MVSAGSLAKGGAAEKCGCVANRRFQCFQKCGCVANRRSEGGACIQPASPLPAGRDGILATGVDSAHATTALPSDEVHAALTTYGGGGPGPVSELGTSTLEPITLIGGSDEERAVSYERIRDDLAAPGLSTMVGGPAAVFSDVNEQVQADIARAESLTIPLVVLRSLAIGQRRGSAPHRVANQWMKPQR